MFSIRALIVQWNKHWLTKLFEEEMHSNRKLGCFTQHFLKLNMTEVLLKRPFHPSIQGNSESPSLNSSVAVYAHP